MNQFIQISKNLKIYAYYKNLKIQSGFNILLQFQKDIKCNKLIY
ncbi:hypothetical protein pb186bvf_013162 [Paramecium bursaria]